mmetsp:Transcript_14592/g.41580  ORF Transcript_14592/g.41580 Transcript_14592/m.41580 type:complete len:318 (+) Transcript_14592:288-1241(+)
MVQQADGRQRGGECNQSLLGNLLLDRGEDLRLKDEHARDANQAGNERGPGVDGRGSDVDLLHILLGPHCPESKRQVGHHGRQEAVPVEGQLGCGGHGHSHHDRHEGTEHRQRRGLPENQLGQNHVECRLECLHRMRQRDGHGGKRQVGGHVADGMHGCRREDERQLFLGDWSLEGCLLGPGKVHRRAVEGPDHHVNRGDKPGVREIVEDHLVLQVERDVEPVPERNIACRYDRRGVLGPDDLGHDPLNRVETALRIGIGRSGTDMECLARLEHRVRFRRPRGPQRSSIAQCTAGGRGKASLVARPQLRGHHHLHEFN